MREGRRLQHESRSPGTLKLMGSLGDKEFRFAVGIPWPGGSSESSNKSIVQRS